VKEHAHVIEFETWPHLSPKLAKGHQIGKLALPTNITS
jgi:hypothetical protein